MIRLLMFLLGKDYEPCKSCETLRLQLEASNLEKERLTNLLIDILQPKIMQTPTQETKDLKPTATLFSRRRIELEAQDRIKAQALKSPLRAVPDDKIKEIKDKETLSPPTTQELEKELGVENG